MKNTTSFRVNNKKVVLVLDGKEWDVDHESFSKNVIKTSKILASSRSFAISRTHGYGVVPHTAKEPSCTWEKCEGFDDARRALVQELL